MRTVEVRFANKSTGEARTVSVSSNNFPSAVAIARNELFRQLGGKAAGWTVEGSPRFKEDGRPVSMTEIDRKVRSGRSISGSELNRYLRSPKGMLFFAALNAGRRNS